MKRMVMACLLLSGCAGPQCWHMSDKVAERHFRYEMQRCWDYTNWIADRYKNCVEEQRIIEGGQ